MLDANIRRDAEVNAALTAKGWKVVRIWQHKVKELEQVVKRIEGAVRGTEEAPKSGVLQSFMS